MVPAPAAVPVERLVGNGLVRPRVVRPVSGVWARVSSRPVPPALSLVVGPRFDDAVLEVALAGVFRLAGGAAFLALRFSFPARGLTDCLRLALAFGRLAPAVLRPAPLRAFAARLPEPARLAEPFLSPFFVPLFFAIAGVSPLGSPGSAGRSAG